MFAGRQPGACFAAHQDGLAQVPKQVRRDAMDNVAMLTVRRQDVPHQALLLRGVPLRARPVLLQVAAERRDAAQTMREQRQLAQR
jgi:hypothetical protein